MAFSQLYKGKVSSESPYPCVYLAYEHQRSGANMQYRFKYKLYLYNTTSSSYYYNNIRFRIYLNGSKVLEINHKSSKAGSSWSTGEKTTGWYTVSNKTSGTTNCYFTAVDTNNSSWTNKTSSTWKLTVDPAYFTSTPTISLKSRTETQIVLNWSTSQACSAIARVSGATISSTTGIGGTSGTITYNNLSANTSYTNQLKFTRKDSGLTTNSGSLATTTYDWPKPTGANNFIIGNGAAIPVSNPCGRTYKLQIFQKNPDPNDQLNGLIGEYNGNYDGTINAQLKGDGTYMDSEGTHNINWDDRQYETIPSKYKDYYYCRVTYGSYIKEYDGNNTYEVNPTNCAPIFNSSAITDIVDISNNAGNISNYNYGGQNRSPKIITSHNTIQLTINEPMIGTKYAEVSGGKYVISTNADTNVKEILYSDISNYPYLITLDDNLKGNILLITAFDSRGVPASFTKNLDSVNYTGPSAVIDVSRNNGVGTEAKIKITGKGTNWTSKMEKIPDSDDSKSRPNVIPVNGIKYKYKEQGISSWSNEWINTNNQEIEIAINNTWSLSDLLIAPDGGFDNTKSYDIKFKVNDLLEEYETEVYTISTAQAYIWKDLENLYLGIKKKPEYTLDVNGDVNVDGVLHRMNICSYIKLENGETLKYSRLFHINLKTYIQGRFIGIKIYLGAGNNGRDNQNAFFNITLQQGYRNEEQSDPDSPSYNINNAGYLGGSYEFHPMNSPFTRNDAEIIITCDDWLNYDVWIMTKIDFVMPNYTVECDNRVEITKSEEFMQGNSPTGADPNKNVISMSKQVIHDGKLIYSGDWYGNVTLSESAANFNRLDIFYRTNDSQYSSISVYEPNGKSVILQGQHDNGTYTWIKTGLRKISGTSITLVKNSEVRIGNNVATTRGEGNFIYITRVIGYR